MFLIKLDDYMKNYYSSFLTVVNMVSDSRGLKFYRIRRMLMIDEKIRRVTRFIFSHF